MGAANGSALLVDRDRALRLEELRRRFDALSPAIATALAKATPKQLMTKGFREREMFGGLAFMYRDRMCFGIVGGDLVVRVAADEFETVMRHRHIRPMDFTGTPLKGFVYVSPPGFARGRRFEHGSSAAGGL